MKGGREAGPAGPEEAERRARARADLQARHKLIEGMIDNNARQLKNEAARGGAEIERECARRDLAAGETAGEAVAALAAIEERLAALETERWRLVCEREWLDTALLDFDAAVTKIAEAEKTSAAEAERQRRSRGNA